MICSTVRATSGAASAYCRKVRAQTVGDAALLKAPRALVEGLRFPATSRLDLGPTVGDNLQARAGLVFSPLDYYRGTLVERTGDADCEEHEAGVHLEEALTGLNDAARLSALRAQQTYLESRRADWRALLAKATERLDARVITAVELHELRQLAEAVERKTEVVRGETERLAAHEPAAPAQLEGLAETYVSRAGLLDHQLERVHALDGWTFRLSGGVIPLPGQAVDWYGLAELGYNLGNPDHERAQRQYADAHAEELRSARYELPARLERAIREGRASLAQARRELMVVETELSFANATSRLLESAEAPGTAHARDALALERIIAESEQVFLRALVDALSSTLEEQHRS